MLFSVTNRTLVGEGLSSDAVGVLYKPTRLDSLAPHPLTPLSLSLDIYIHIYKSTTTYS